MTTYLHSKEKQKLQVRFIFNPPLWDKTKEVMKTAQDVIEKWAKRIGANPQTNLNYYHSDTIKEMLSDFKETLEPKYDFTCPNSGEKFMLGDEMYFVSAINYDDKAFEGNLTITDIAFCSPRLAYFHTAESALEWSKKKFGVKEEEKQKEVKEYQQDVDHLFVQKDLLLQSIQNFEKETGLKVVQINTERHEHSVYTERITIKSDL